MRRVIELGYYRMPRGMMEGLIVPCGWVVEELQDGKWMYVNKVHPSEAYELARLTKPTSPDSIGNGQVA